jgi:anti-sigma B factor antagonist
VDLDIKQSGNICTLKVKGPFKSGTSVDGFNKAIKSALDSGHIYIVLNLEAMPVLDSSGIGAIVNALRLAKRAGGDVKLVNPSSFAEKTFKMVGILNLFTVYATEGSAVTAFT